MRFTIGPVPETIDFAPDESWHALREPTPRMLMWISLPIGVGAAAGVLALWFSVTPLGTKTWTLSVPAFLASFVGIIVVHELIHAFVHPQLGMSRDTVIGFWLQHVTFYAAYTGELNRNRFIVIFLTPLVVLTLLPLGVAAAAQMHSAWAAYVSTFNALLSCGDVVAVCMICLQIPRTAIVRNRGWTTYWTTNTA